MKRRCVGNARMNAYMCACMCSVSMYMHAHAHARTHTRRHTHTNTHTHTHTQGALSVTAVTAATAAGYSALFLAHEEDLNWQTRKSVRACLVCTCTVVMREREIDIIFPAGTFQATSDCQEKIASLGPRHMAHIYTQICINLSLSVSIYPSIHASIRRCIHLQACTHTHTHTNTHTQLAQGEVRQRQDTAPNAATHRQSKTQESETAQGFLNHYCSGDDGGGAAAHTETPLVRGSKDEMREAHEWLRWCASVRANARDVGGEEGWGVAEGGGAGEPEEVSAGKEPRDGSVSETEVSPAGMREGVVVSSEEENAGCLSGMCTWTHALSLSHTHTHTHTHTHRHPGGSGKGMGRSSCLGRGKQVSAAGRCWPWDL